MPPRGRCPFFAAAGGRLGIMFAARAERWTCPACAGYAEGTCPAVAGHAGGHAQSSPRPEDTRASCSLPALSDGHAQRARATPEDMPSVRGLPGRTCPIFATARGHSGIMFAARAERWTCPACAGHAGEHAQRLRAAREDMPIRGAGGWACPVACGTVWRYGRWAHALRPRGRLLGGYWPARSSKSTSSPSSSSVSWPSSFRCRYISTAPAAASRIPAMRKMMPPSRAAV